MDTKQTNTGSPDKIALKARWLEHDPKQFWLTSAKRAMLANELALILCPAKESECFTIAFLQDMALPFLACHRPEEYGPIFEKWYLQGGSLAQLEREVLDWDHAEVATWICSEWGLPENIAAGIGGHHHNAIAGYETPAPVELAAMLRDDDSDSSIEEIKAKTESDHNIPPEKIQEILESSFAKAKELARMIA